VVLDDVAADRQAEAGTSGVVASIFLHPVKAFEDTLLR
jgi:hypothetical protein